MGKKRQYNSHKDHIGRVRWKLFEVLRQEGFSIPSPECLWMQEGGYRRWTWDLARWGADWKDEQGHHWTIYSWDTMTDCARYGILIHKNTDDLLNRHEISRKEPKVKRTVQ